MKKILLILVLLIATAAKAQVNIPDPAFKALLLSADENSPIAWGPASQTQNVKIDTNENGQIEASEALQIVRLEISGTGASDLTGLEAFTNLTRLQVNYAFGLAQVNLSGLVNLESLECSNNTLLTTLDVSMLPNLKFLDCRTNNLTTLNLGTYDTLQSLNCGYNALTTLDLSHLTNLRDLYCYENLLTSLSVSHLLDLTGLDFSNNDISQINVLPLVNLTLLHCSNNGLTQLNVSSLTQLNNFYCDGNQLTSLNISGLTALETLMCERNPIGSLDLSSAVLLRDLNCSRTLIANLDTTPLSVLQYLGFGSESLVSFTLSQSIRSLYAYNLTLPTLTISLPLLYQIDVYDSHCTEIDFSGSPQIGTFYFKGCDQLVYVNGKNGSAYPSLSVSHFDSPNLQMVCANEQHFDDWANALSEYNVQINSYCSFTPGGNYNTITGSVRFDNEGDGCDAGDALFPNMRVTLAQGAESGVAFTNHSGNYTFYTQSGNHNVALQIENPTYFTITPATQTVNFASVNGLTETRNFCITANGIHPEAEISIVPIGAARPGFDSGYKLVYRNTGNQTVSGSIVLNFDDARTDFLSANPAADVQIAGTLVWNYTALAPFETRNIDFVLNLNGPMETPPLNQDDILDFAVDLNYQLPDVGTYLAEAELHQTIVNSLDPNDKTCLEGNVISPEMIGDYVHYNINFENIGTAEAINVVVKDVIDTSKFDLSTLQVIYASHPMVTRISGNVVSFIFENINLPGTEGDNKGNVLFKLKTLPTLALGNSISNKADIFFDYNFPIQTNEATSTFSVLKNKDFAIDTTIGIEPNPAKDKVRIKAGSNIKSMELFDLQGRLLRSSIENKKETSVDISNQQNGIYFLNITTEKGSKTEKIIKE